MLNPIDTKIEVIRVMEPEDLKVEYDKWLNSFDEKHIPFIHETKQNVIYNGSREIIYFTILYSVKTV